MKRKKKYYYVNLTQEELKILREGGPTEDIDEILLRIFK